MRLSTIPFFLAFTIGCSSTGNDGSSDPSSPSDADSDADSDPDRDSDPNSDPSTDPNRASAAGEPKVDLLGSAAVDFSTIAGDASWEEDASSGDFVYDNAGTAPTSSALLYSAESFQSDTGFRLTIEYTTGSIDADGEHQFSFGLISNETALETYAGQNPFGADSTVSGLGVNLTSAGSASARGLNYSDGSHQVTLDESGTRTEFLTGESTKVHIEIGIGGSWQYRIDGQYEASGVLHDQFEVDGAFFDEFDPSKNYHVVVYGQDDNGGGKSIQSFKLERAPAAGKRADTLRGTWCSGVDGSLVDDRLKALKTVDSFQIRFSDGASLSAQHFAPHKLMESLPGGDAVVPTWGDTSLDEPETDALMDQAKNITGAGYKVKAYSNAENFVGDNAEQFETFVASWMDFCDTNPDAQAFLESQPYHSGVWNSSTEQYDDASSTYPNRKYMFCYAEFVLKEYALRYGPHVGSWVFDSAKEMVAQGDSATSGIIEEQRIYQAFSDAVHAGNPDIPIAYNNGRSTANYDSFPYAHAKRFEDFTFGHAFGGNGDHADKDAGTFDRNYLHVERMTETDGYVHAGGAWEWDDLIVGNFHSKLSTGSWKYGPTQAWTQEDFNAWNLEAMQAGGSMTWDGSYNRGITTIYDWVYLLLEGLDEYLMVHENPGAPNWARSATILPRASAGAAYSHTLIEGDHFWDPEGDEILALTATGSAPSWLTIEEDPDNAGHWILSGTPSGSGSYEFELELEDASGTRSRSVELLVAP